MSFTDRATVIDEPSPTPAPDQRGATNHQQHRLSCHSSQSSNVRNFSMPFRSNEEGWEVVRNQKAKKQAQVNQEGHLQVPKPIVIAPIDFPEAQANVTISPLLLDSKTDTTSTTPDSLSNSVAKIASSISGTENMEETMRKVPFEEGQDTVVDQVRSTWVIMGAEQSLSPCITLLFIVFVAALGFIIDAFVKRYVL